MVHNAPRLDAIFGALADPIRRAVITELERGERSVGELAEPFGISLTGFIKHLAVLERAELIDRSKRGRIVHCRLRHPAMKEAMAWLRHYERFWSERLDRLGALLEREETKAWKLPSTTRPASRSAASTRRRSPASTPRSRTRKK